MCRAAPSLQGRIRIVLRLGCCGSGRSGIQSTTRRLARFRLRSVGIITCYVLSANDLASGGGYCMGRKWKPREEEEEEEEEGFRESGNT